MTWFQRFERWVRSIIPPTLMYPVTWLGHSSVMVVGVTTSDFFGSPWPGFFIVAGFYSLREVESTLYGRPAPWWDSVLDVVCPVAVGLLLVLT